MVKPITPEEAAKCSPSIPAFVIDAVNQLISEKTRGKSTIIIKQSEIVKKLVEDRNANKDEIYENKWLDFEDIYRDAGWVVTYDKPSFNESYDAYFKFEFPDMVKKTDWRW